MSAPADADKPTTDRLTLVIRSVPELTTQLADAVYAVVDGECEIAMRDRLLYIELANEDVDSWSATPQLLSAVQRVEPEAELVRVEAADMVTAAERAQAPLRSSA
jgi:hypothetical protein